jgi:hypothetical protein
MMRVAERPLAHRRARQEDLRRLDEAEIQPIGMLNDGRREAMPAVRVRSHLQG